MVQRLSKIYDVVCQKLPTTPEGTPDPARFGAPEWEITTFFIDAYFLPLHTEVDALIRTRMHLLEPGELPDGFRLFFDHEAKFECLYRLWKEKGVPWEPTAEDVRWPRQFEVDVATILERLRTRQQQFLRDLKGS
jgi:hypothetical protein